MTSWAILTDVTRCIGCEKCVTACRRSNETGTSRPRPWTDGFAGLTAERWTAIERVRADRYVRRQCRHCRQPACASVCPVGALVKTPEGPVVYDASICMGCRYCMVACPYEIPRYEWDSAAPRVRKCIGCHDSIRTGRLSQPACTDVCPVDATVFGTREDLLREAHRRIEAEPDRYRPVVFGETEVGGTSVLYLSDVDLALPDRFGERPLPERTWAALRTVPGVFVGVGAAALGLRWVIGRRMKLRGDVPEDAATPESPAGEEDAR